MKKLTSWEIRARIVFALMTVLRVKLRDLYDSYPYNPYDKTEVDNFWSDVERNYEHK